MKKPLNKNLRAFLIIYLIAVVGFVGYLAVDAYQNYQSRQELRELSARREATALVDQAVAVLATHSTVSPDDNQNQATDTPGSTTAIEPNNVVLPQYTDLYLQNKDLVGWISIEGTELDYPVMYTPYESDYYLYRNFEKQEDDHGLPFVDYRSSIVPMSTNILVHGHNMKDGSMFATLADYQSKYFFEQHPMIQFDTIVETGQYEIYSAFMSQITEEEEESKFLYYEFIRADTEQEFNDYVQHTLELSMYDTGIIPEYGDQLLTLSTCSYHVRDGRMVVVARKVA